MKNKVKKLIVKLMVAVTLITSINVGTMPVRAYEKNELYECPICASKGMPSNIKLEEYRKENTINYSYECSHISGITSDGQYVKGPYKFLVGLDENLEPDDCNCGSHSFTKTVIEKTCTKDGYIAYRCNGCNLVYKFNFVPGGHVESVVETKNPTCSELGYTKYKCNLCDYVSIRYVSTTPHVYTDTVVAPTCTTKGYTLHKCECGDSYIDSYTDMKEHSYNDTVTAPTCTEKGYTTHVCNDCKHTYKDSETNPTGHSWDLENPRIEGEYVIYGCKSCSATKSVKVNIPSSEETKEPDSTQPKGEEVVEPTQSNNQTPIVEEEVVEPAQSNNQAPTVEPAQSNNQAPTVEPGSNGSNYSNSKPATKKVTVAKVSNLKLKNSAKQTMKISYKKISKAKYQIQYSTSKNFKKNVKTKTTGNNEITIKNLKKGKTYYVRVRAYKVSGNKKVYGKWATAKVVIKK